MGYCTNRLDLTLADVTTSGPERYDIFDGYHDYDVGYDWDCGDEIDLDWEIDPPYDEFEDYEPDDDYVVPDPEDDHDAYQHLPFTGKISPASCLGKRVIRPSCLCCGGVCGIRAARRRPNNAKPRCKDHRNFRQGWK